MIAISTRQRREIERLGIATGEKLAEIPLGFDLAPFSDPPRGVLRRELGLAGDVPLVGIVARLVPVKRVDVSLAAAARLGSRWPEAHFVVVGDGEERDRLRGQAERTGTSARTHFLRWHSALAATYGDLDVVVLASDNEGTPVGVLEALAARRPVVATAVGGVPDVLGANERGLLAPPRDATALATAITRLLGAPTVAERLASAGHSCVVARHGADVLVRRVSELYTELVDPQS